MPGHTRWLSLSLLFVLLLGACQAPPPPPPTPTPVALLGASERKVDSVLLDLLLNYRLRGAQGAEDYARSRGLLTPDNHVRVTLVLDTNEVQPVVDKVTGMGANVT